MNRSRLANNLNRHRRGSWLIGCGVTLAVMLVLAIVGVIFVMNSWRGWTASGSKTLVSKMLDETSIQQAEKDEIMTHMDTLMTRFERKDISVEELGKVITRLTEGPLLPAAITGAAQHQYIAPSDLTDEQKADAKVQLARVAQGIYNEQITNNELGAILDPIQAPIGTRSSTRIKLDGMDHEIALKEPQDVTSDELLTLIENARAAADEAQIEQSPTPIDLSNEVAIAIARALGEDPMLWLPPGAVVPDEPGADDAQDADIPPAEDSEPEEQPSADDEP